ncbi:MAG: cupin domain-containing protein [Desulfotomaculum sp.]|nr:cupin domain-containing protein [Desulfotomaculum sp.]
MENGKYIKNITLGAVLEMAELVTYQEGRVESRTLVQTDQFSVTLFAFDKGEGIGTHSAPGDALVYVLDGNVAITIGEDEAVNLKSGQTIVMPADIPHSLVATEKFKMLLIVVKG